MLEDSGDVSFPFTYSYFPSGTLCEHSDLIRSTHRQKHLLARQQKISHARKVKEYKKLRFQHFENRCMTCGFPHTLSSNVFVEWQNNIKVESFLVQTTS